MDLKKKIVATGTQIWTLTNLSKLQIDRTKPLCLVTDGKRDFIVADDLSHVIGRTELLRTISLGCPFFGNLAYF